MVDAEKMIFNKLNNSSHYLNDMCAYNYYNIFWKSIDEITGSEYFKSMRDVDVFCNKLKIGQEYSMNKYLQGVSEFMLYIFASQQGYIYDTDVILRNDNNCDVDIQIQYKGFSFNIEVKCPEIKKKCEDTEKLHINTGFRSVSKDILDSKLGEVEEDVIRKIIQNSEGQYNGFVYDKLEDNKILSYLSSCDDKFIDAEKNALNILLISLPSDEMQDYWGYLYNQYSGIFTDNFVNRYKNKKGEYYTISDIEKTDVIILSNIVSGHIKPKDIFDSWNINTYCSLLCMNIHSQKFKQDRNNEAYKMLYEFFPNDNKRFEEGLTEFQKYQIDNNIMLDPIWFTSYLKENYRYL